MFRQRWQINGFTQSILFVSMVFFCFMFEAKTEQRQLKDQNILKAIFSFYFKKDGSIEIELIDIHSTNPTLRLHFHASPELTRIGVEEIVHDCQYIKGVPMPIAGPIFLFLMDQVDTQVQIFCPNQWWTTDFMRIIADNNSIIQTSTKYESTYANTKITPAGLKLKKSPTKPTTKSTCCCLIKTLNKQATAMPVESIPCSCDCNNNNNNKNNITNSSLIEDTKGSAATPKCPCANSSSEAAPTPKWRTMVSTVPKAFTQHLVDYHCPYEETYLFKQSKQKHIYDLTFYRLYGLLKNDGYLSIDYCLSTITHYHVYLYAGKSCGKPLYANLESLSVLYFCCLLSKWL